MATLTLALAVTMSFAEASLAPTGTQYQLIGTRPRELVLALESR